jgi:hypothetical protein
VFSARAVFVAIFFSSFSPGVLFRRFSVMARPLAPVPVVALVFVAVMARGVVLMAVVAILVLSVCQYSGLDTAVTYRRSTYLGAMVSVATPTPVALLVFLLFALGKLFLKVLQSHICDE